MSRATPDQIIAHVDLIRAVDRLLTQAEIVRHKRNVLEQMLPPEQDTERTALPLQPAIRESCGDE